MSSRYLTGCALALVFLTGSCGDDSVAPPSGPVVASTEITTAPTTLHAIDQTLQLAAVARDSAGDPIPSASIGWTSLAPATIAVSGTGLVTAKANGTAEIVAAAGGKSDTVLIGLTQLIDTVVLTPPSWSATRVGQRLAFTAAALDANGHPVADASYKYRSSDEGIFTVDTLGVATAASAGSATLTAYAAIDDSAVAGIAVQITPPGGVGLVYTLFPAMMDSSPVILRNGSLAFSQNTYSTPRAPTSPWQGPAVISRFAWSRDNIAVLTDEVDGKGTLWLKDRVSEWALVAIGDARDVKIEVSRFGWLTADGLLRMKTDPHGPVTNLDGNGDVLEFQLAGTRIAALKRDGTLRIKEGTIDAPWVSVASGVARFHIRGTHIAVLDSAGQFEAKVGVSDPWTVLASDSVADFRVSSQLVGILKENGSLLVKEGINGTWATLATAGVRQFELEGDRIVWLFENGDVRVKDGPFSATVRDIGTGMREVRLQGDFIGQVSESGELSVKRGIDGTREVIGTYPSLQQYRLIADVPSPPSRLEAMDYPATRMDCADEGDGCVSPEDNHLPSWYGRWCGAGRGAGAVLDPMDEICKHHDFAGPWYQSRLGWSDAGLLESCIVMYGLRHARLTLDGALIPRGTAEYDSHFFTTMPELYGGTEAYWGHTAVCGDASLDDFTAGTAAVY